MSLEEVLDYWRNPGGGNAPADYIQEVHQHRSELLYELIHEHTDLDEGSSILEVGCNAGRNLNYLYWNGFRNLTGLDINESAIKLFRERFPDAAGSTVLLVGSADDVLPAIKTPFDLVFTDSVLEHIHPDIEKPVFDNIVRLAGQYIITIEEESITTDRHFARDYSQVFSGFRQVAEDDYPADARIHWRVLAA